MAAGVFTRRLSCLLGLFRILIHQPELCIVETLKSTYGTRFRELQGIEQPCSQAGQKGPRCEAREKSTSGGVLGQYVGATPLGAGMIPKAIELNYSKRLLRAGWWQMGLFQRSDLI